MKVNKIFIALTAVFLLSEILVFTGCKSKKMKLDPVSVGSDYSSGTGQTGTLSIENGHILDDGDENSTYLNPSTFYNSDGTLVKTVYITSDTTARRLEDDNEVHLKKTQMVKLVAFDGHTALILLPISCWPQEHTPSYAKVSVTKISPILPHVSLDMIDIDQFKNYFIGSWLGTDIFGNSDNKILMNFYDSYYAEDANLVIDRFNYMGYSYGDYDIENENGTLILKIKIFSNDEDYYNEVSSRDFTKYEFIIRTPNENSFTLEERGSFKGDTFVRKVSFKDPYEIEQFNIDDLNFYNSHHCLEHIKRLMESDSESKKTYAQVFSKFGIYIDNKEYKEVYDSYWDTIVKANETKSYPQFNQKYNVSSQTEITSEEFYNNYLKEFEKRNPKQLSIEEAMKDYESIKKFYYKGERLFQYVGVSLYDGETKAPKDVYSEPNVKSERVFEFTTPHFTKIVGLGPKATINGVTSHWVQIVLPQFAWNSNKPVYGWIFGAYIQFPKEENGESLWYCSDSFTESKNMPMDYEYEDIEIENSGYDSIFYSPDLYDANENYETTFYRYLKYSQDKRCRKFNYDISQIPDPIEMDFIRAGVYGKIYQSWKQIKEKLYLEEIYNTKIQNSKSLYPVFLKGADNLTVSKNDISKDPETKITQYKNGDKVYHMIYHSYRDSDYRIHDEIEVIENPKSNDSKTIAEWKSDQFDIISETRAYLSFDSSDKPVLHVLKLNGTFRTKEEY